MSPLPTRPPYQACSSLATSLHGSTSKSNGHNSGHSGSTPASSHGYLPDPTDYRLICPYPSPPLTISGSDNNRPLKAPKPITPQTFPNTAILPLFKNTTHNTSTHDVLPVNHSPFPPEHSAYSSSPLPINQHGFHQASRGYSPTTATSSHHAINLRPSSPSASHLTELIAHHDLPRSLPPLPRTSSQHSASSTHLPSPSFSASTNLSALSQRYMSMLQNPSLTDSSDRNTMTVDDQQLLDPGRTLDTLFDRDVNTSTFGADLPSTSLSFDSFFEQQKAFSTPFDEPSASFDGVGGVLDTPVSMFDTPASAFDTPALDFSPSSAMDTSPATLRDLDDDDLNAFAMPLFGFDTTAPAVPANNTNVAADSSSSALPATTSMLMLDIESMITMANTPSQGTVSMPSPSLSSSSSSPAYSQPQQLPSPTSPFATSNAPVKTKKVTGHRKNLAPSNLVPVDAPTQPRSYLKPSATSRKAIPAAFAGALSSSAVSSTAASPSPFAATPAKGKKRGVSEALLDDEETLQDAIEAKRRQNTVAARRSRMRKLEHVRELEAAVERLTAERDAALERAETAEARLRGELL